MRKYLNLVKQHVGHDLDIRFVQVPREENVNTDHLAKVVSAEGMILDGRVLSFVQYALATNQIEVQAVPPRDN